MPGGSTLHENPFVELVQRYYYDPVLFVQEVLGESPDEKQARIMMQVATGEKRQTAVRSGHRVGKTWLVSRLIVWHACTRRKQKTICTSSTEKQLFEGLAPETKSAFKSLPIGWRGIWEIKAESIVHTEDPEHSFVSFRTAKAENAEAFAGIHEESVLLICDEASGIPPEIFESLGGSMAAPQARLVLTGNPVRTSGTFFDIFKTKLRADWWTDHISCIDHPRVSQEWVDIKRREYGGEDDNRFRVRVLGEFPKADDDTIIPFELVEAALTRDVEPNPHAAEIWGLDCGRGGDPSALAKRKGNTLVEPTQIKSTKDLMELVGWVKQQYDVLMPSERPVEINVDVIGMGGGVVDRMRELDMPVRGINTAEEAAANDRYRNLRSELWYKGAEWFRRRDCTIRGDDALLGELVAQKGGPQSSGKDYAFSKEEMKSRFKMASPNRADAFLLTLASDHITMAHGSSTTSNWKTPVKRGLRFF